MYLILIALLFSSVLLDFFYSFPSLKSSDFFLYSYKQEFDVKLITYSQLKLSWKLHPKAFYIG